jgi:hypothetical protein
MKKLSFILFLTVSLCSKAQINLVVDPSMEEYDSIVLPYIPPDYECDTFLRIAKYWRSPSSGSPDYIIGKSDTCYFPNWPYTCCVPRNSRGWQWPKEEDAYYFIGMFTYYQFYDTTRQE